MMVMIDWMIVSMLFAPVDISEIRKRSRRLGNSFRKEPGRFYPAVMTLGSI